MYDPAPKETVLIAAGKALDKHLGKFKLDPGSHLIDESITIKLTGMLQKAPEQEQQWKPELPLPMFVTLLCNRLRLSRNEARDLIAQCAKLAIDLRGEIPSKPGFADRLRDADEAITAAIDNAPKVPKTKAGNTTWLGTAVIEKAH